MTKDYWQQFWDEHAVKSCKSDPQVQVLRTLNKAPIDTKVWTVTLKFIIEQLDLKADYSVLDLCCGNGLISKEIATQTKSVTAVDISAKLLDQFDTSSFPNINKVRENALSLNLAEESCDVILLYAGIQYFSPSEVVELMEKVERWLVPGGLLYIGDIPDHKKLWAFFNSREREAAYFSSLQKKAPIIGEWFDFKFLEKLGFYTGFSRVEKVEQTPEMIYSFFRYDMRLIK
jgi:ubiquinone/menaquinone biosynthesis C-methylase UbiE